jgi:hypothetical protein
VLGMTPASLFLSAFTITMNRIALLRLVFISAGRFRYPHSGFLDMTNGVLRHRHVQRNYFRGNCGRLSFCFDAFS